MYMAVLIFLKCLDLRKNASSRTSPLRQAKEGGKTVESIIARRSTGRFSLHRFQVALCR